MQCQPKQFNFNGNQVYLRFVTDIYITQLMFIHSLMDFSFCRSNIDECRPVAAFILLSWLIHNSQSTRHLLMCSITFCSLEPTNQSLEGNINLKLTSAILNLQEIFNLLNWVNAIELSYPIEIIRIVFG